MKHLWFLFIIAIGVLAYQADTRANDQKKDDLAWATEFAVEKAELSASGRNPYFILELGYQLVLEAGKERLTITVLDETKTVAGVETRVVEERETKDGKLVEVSRNYFAISRRTGSVFYFGEDVDIYKGNKIVSHEGAWLAGVKEARFGLMMPGEVRLGARYYQEIAPQVAMDRAEIVSLSEIVKTPAGEFKDCLKVEETTPLEPGAKEYKYYAPGIGLVQDGLLKLVKYGKAKTEPLHKKDGVLRSLNELFAPKELLGDLARIGSFRDRKNLIILGAGLGLTGLAMNDDRDIAGALFKKEPLGELHDAMNFIGSAQVLYPTLVGTFFAGKALDKPGLTRTTAQMTQALLLTDLIVMPTKMIVRRTRPDGSNKLSFPSGHTAGTFALATVLHRNHGRKVGIAAYAAATMVGLSRLVDDRKHFLSDTITGAMIGIIVGNTVADRFKRTGITIRPVRGSFGRAGIGLTIEF